jgi:hypothetical protein
VATGVGLLNLAAVPVCSADFYPADAEDACVVGSLIVAGVGVGLGIPFLIVGYSQHSDYNAWKARNGVARALLDTHIAFTQNAAMLSYSTTL